MSDKSESEFELFAEFHELAMRHIVDSKLGERFCEEVKKHFLENVYAAFLNPIGEFLMRTGLTNTDIAKLVGVDRTAVSKWISEGKISFKAFARILCAFNVGVEDFGFPSPGDVVPEAYCATVAYVRKELNRRKGSIKVNSAAAQANPSSRDDAKGEGNGDCNFSLCQEDFEYLRVITCTDPSWLLASIEPRPDGEQQHLEIAAKQICTQVSVRFPQTRERSWNDLKQLLSDWLKAWLLTVAILPHTWDTR